MSFKLVIECSKDIDKLEIDFSDGTSVVTHSKTPKEQPKNVQKVKTVKQEQTFLNTEDDYNSIPEEIVKLPEIDETTEINVAEELQNLNI